MSFKNDHGSKHLLIHSFIHIFTDSQCMPCGKKASISTDDTTLMYIPAYTKASCYRAGSFCVDKTRYGPCFFSKGLQSRIKTVPPTSTISMRGSKSITIGFKRPQDQQTF